MILMLTAAPRARECAAALERLTGEPVRVAENVRRALELLNQGEYSVLVIDQCTVETDGDEIESLLASYPGVMPVFANFAIQGAPRVLRLARSALQRREHEKQALQRAAEVTLRNELTGDITGILITSELALGAPALPAEVEAKLRAVCELAARMRSRLQFAG